MLGSEIKSSGPPFILSILESSLNISIASKQSFLSNNSILLDLHILKLTFSSFNSVSNSIAKILIYK